MIAPAASSMVKTATRRWAELNHLDLPYLDGRIVWTLSRESGVIGACMRDRSRRCATTHPVRR